MKFTLSVCTLRRIINVTYLIVTAFAFPEESSGAVSKIIVDPEKVTCHVRVGMDQSAQWPFS